MNGTQQLESGNGVSMGRHVTVNRLEVPRITRSALNNTYRCQASNTKLVPPVERSIRIDMLRKYKHTYTQTHTHTHLMFIKIITKRKT